MSISFDHIKNQVNGLLQKEFELPLEKLQPDARLYEDLGLDSLDAVDMLVHLEAAIGVKVAGEKFMHVRVLNDVYLVVHDVVRAGTQDAGMVFPVVDGPSTRSL